MRLWQSLLGRAAEQPWEERETVTLAQLLADRVPTWSGESVTPDTALRLSAVWSCVNLLASTISELPVDCYRQGQRDEIPVPLVLQEPSAGMELPEFVYAVLSSLLLRGNCYALVTARSGPGLVPSQVELLRPDDVGVNMDEHGQVVYRVLGQEVDRSNMWHVRAYRQAGQLLGLSPIAYAKESIGLGLAAEKFGAQFFGDGATPTGLLTTADKLGHDQVADLSRAWKEAHTKRRTPAVLSGDLKWQTLTIAPEESQFIETAKFNVAQIARVFGVPPELVGSEVGNSLTYSNVQGQALHFLKFSLQPWISRVERALSRLIPSRQRVRFNPDALLRSTTKERFDAYKVAIDAGFMTRNEIRALEDLPPLPGGDTPPAPTSNGNGKVTDVGAIA